MVGRRENFGLISPSFEALLVLVKRRKLGFEGFKKTKGMEFSHLLVRKLS